VRPFDAKADGTVFGDAVAALVLQRHEDAWWWYHSIYIIYTIYIPYIWLYMYHIYMYAGLHIMLYIYLWLCYMYIYISMIIYICIIIYYDLSYIYICCYDIRYTWLHMIYGSDWTRGFLPCEVPMLKRVPQRTSGRMAWRMPPWRATWGNLGETLESGVFILNVEDFGIFFWGYPLVM
jgi:hypothetical protein